MMSYLYSMCFFYANYSVSCCFMSTRSCLFYFSRTYILISWSSIVFSNPSILKTDAFFNSSCCWVNYYNFILLVRSWWWYLSIVYFCIFSSAKCFMYCSDSSLCYFSSRVSGFDIFYKSFVLTILSHIFVKNLLSVLRLLFSNFRAVFSDFSSFISYSICFNFFSFSYICYFAFFRYCFWVVISSIFFSIFSYLSLSLLSNSLIVFISCCFSFWDTRICFWC